jgi:inositol-1,3,4-trisphosphate 5/6-kinase/inositol-tetrakisphosphate 1-kinase
MESKDSDSANKIDSIKDYLYRHPSASIIDPFEAVRAVVSRARTCRRLRELEDDFERRHGGRRRCPFRQPRFAVSESPELLGEAVQRAGLSFPVICKPIEACGTPLSHSMVVAVDAEGLSLVESPSIAQEYINHSGLFFKVYVIDHDVMVFQRPSLPDILAESCGEAASSSVRSVVFDSRFAYPTVEDFYFSGGGALCSDGEQSASSETSGSVALDTRRRQHRRRKPRNEDLAAHSAHKHHNASAGNKHSKKQGGCRSCVCF